MASQILSMRGITKITPRVIFYVFVPLLRYDFTFFSGLHQQGPIRVGATWHRRREKCEQMVALWHVIRLRDSGVTFQTVSIHSHSTLPFIPWPLLYLSCSALPSQNGRVARGDVSIWYVSCTKFSENDKVPCVHETIRGVPTRKYKR